MPSRYKGPKKNTRHLPKKPIFLYASGNTARGAETPEKTSFVHATATVLQVSTGQNAEHSGPANQRREHSTGSNVTINTSLNIPLQRPFWSVPAMKFEELLDQVAAWSQEGKPPAQYLYTALGWRHRSSLRRKRREVKRGDTRVSVPVPDPSHLILFAVPHDFDTSRSTPDCTVSTSVPEVRLASVFLPEPHPLDGVLQLNRRRP